LPIRRIKGFLGLGHHDGVPRADKVTFAGGAEASATVSGGGGGDFEGALRASAGGIWDRRTGRRTYFLSLEGEAQQALRATFGVQGEGSVVVGLTLGRDSKPLELAANLAAQAADQAGLPAILAGERAP